MQKQTMIDCVLHVISTSMSLTTTETETWIDLLLLVNRFREVAFGKQPTKLIITYEKEKHASSL